MDMTTEEQAIEKSEKLVDEINALPNEQKNLVLQSVMVQYQGPIPPASELEKYEMIQHGFANRIMVMAEENSSHIRRCEQKDVEATIAYNARGQIFAFIVTLVTLALCALSIITGNTFLALIFGAAGISSVVITFIKAMKANNESSHKS